MTTGTAGAAGSPPADQAREAGRLAAALTPLPAEQVLADPRWQPLLQAIARELAAPGPARDQVQRDPGHYGPGTPGLLRLAEQASPAGYAAASRRREQLRPAAAAAYAGVDVLLGPVMPWTAPLAGQPAGSDGGRFEQPYNLTGAPAIAVPCGITEAGLPVALQLSASPGADLALLAAARRVEKAVSPARPEGFVTSR